MLYYIVGGKSYISVSHCFHGILENKGAVLLEGLFYWRQYGNPFMAGGLTSTSSCFIYFLLQMIGHKKKSVPIFASDLGLLEPVSRPAGDRSVDDNNVKELKATPTTFGNNMVDNTKSCQNLQVQYDELYV